MTRVRGNKGKFVQKSDEHRHVRSLRVTNSTWSELGHIAEDFSITRADLIEKLIDDHVLRDYERFKQENEELKRHIHVLQDRLAEIEASESLPKNSRQLDLFPDSHHLTREKLDEILIPVLKAFKNEFGVGEGSERYKKTKKAFDSFIDLIIKEIS